MIKAPLFMIQYHNYEFDRIVMLGENHPEKSATYKTILCEISRAVIAYQRGDCTATVAMERIAKVAKDA